MGVASLGFLKRRKPSLVETKIAVPVAGVAPPVYLFVAFLASGHRYYPAAELHMRSPRLVEPSVAEFIRAIDEQNQMVSQLNTS